TTPKANPRPPTARVSPPRAPAQINDTPPPPTNRNSDNSANPLTPAPIPGIGIHKLRDQLRYAGHELPEFLRSDHRRDAGKSGRGRDQRRRQFGLHQPAAGLESKPWARGEDPAVSRTCQHHEGRGVVRRGG